MESRKNTGRKRPSNTFEARKNRVMEFLHELHRRTTMGGSSFTMSELQYKHGIAKFSNVPYDCGIVRADGLLIVWAERGGPTEEMALKYMESQYNHTKRANERRKANKARKAAQIEIEGVTPGPSPKVAENAPKSVLEGLRNGMDLSDLDLSTLPLPLYVQGTIGGVFVKLTLRKAFPPKAKPRY